MRKLFYLLALISISILIFTVYNYFSKAQVAPFSVNFELKGFEGEVTDPAFTALKKKFNDRIDKYTTEENSDQNRYFWLSLFVTALTAGATLVSSIQAAKKTDPPAPPAPAATRTFAVIIAILTFCSTLSNFLSGHYNDEKNQATKNVAAVTSMRNAFYAAYDKAASADDKSKVITEYDQKSD